MNRIRALLAPLLVPAVLLLAAPSASAHPLGNLSVNTYDGVVVSMDGVRVDHVEDVAEVPTVAALRAADTDGDGDASPAELSTWADGRCAAAAERIRVAADAAPLALAVRSAHASTAAGQAGLATLRVECDLTAPVRITGRTAVTVDAAAPSDLGWREITVAGDGTTIAAADVPATSVSVRLTSYPGDLTTSPDERTATATIEPGGARLGAVATGPVGVVTRGVDAVTTTVEGLATQSGPLALLLLVLGGLGLGAMHALAPGHGKTVVAMAALAGRGTRRRELARSAATLGASITVAHTGSVVLVAVALTALGAVVPAALFPALAVLAGAIVVAVGIGLLRGRSGGHVHGPGGHTHGDDHDHTHHHEEGGLHYDGHHHDGHEHDRQGHAHDVERVRTATGAATAVVPATRVADHDHDPGHEPVPARRRTLVALGAVGGLTPSPTALVVLLGTLAVGRPLAGLLAVLAFGAGMALTLVGAGLLAVVLGRRAAVLATARGIPARWLAVVPRLAGVAVVCAGLVLALRGVVDLVA